MRGIPAIIIAAGLCAAAVHAYESPTQTVCQDVCEKELEKCQKKAGGDEEKSIACDAAYDGCMEKCVE